jgi:ribulose-phosphate 3-epimerase
MDGELAPTHSLALDEIWWPHNLVADIHLMYKMPMLYLDKLISLKPHLVIIHAEADLNHMHFAALLHERSIEAGLAILPDTSVASIERIMHSFDQILIFAGNLGYQGGEADLSLISKVKEVKELHPDAVIAWDGGINDHNAKELANAGVKVLNVGGFIQHSDNPKDAYDKIRDSLRE